MENKQKETKNKNTNVKAITKEVIIFLLWTLAAILILGVILYQYVPTNKIIPETISYTTPENVKTALQSEQTADSEESQEPITFESKIDSTDLSNYRKTQEYVPGKKNPFAAVQQTDTVTDNSSSSGTTSNGSTTSNNANTSNNTSSSTISSSSSGTSSSNSGYLPDKGTK